MSDGLYTRTWGDHGSRVVLCHGLFGQGRNWTQVAKALATDHRVLLVDLPDHGRSPWTDRFDYLAAADRVADLLGDEPAALVGHSMGGKVAMIAALAHPQAVERLCVVDVAPVVYPDGSEFEGFVAAMRDLDLASLQTRDEADTLLSPAIPAPTVRAFLLQNLRREGEVWRWQLNLDVLGDDLDTIRGWPEDAVAALDPFPGPVLWVAGERSDYIQDDHAATMERWFPRVRRVTVRGAGHWVHAERPAVVVEVLRRFLAGASAG
ncbi:MAG: alpha/beta fold hydrolase [Nocardioides sp.]